MTADKVKMLLPSISNMQMFIKKTFNFVNTDKPCCKKAKPCEKTFNSYVARLKKFVDYETTNDCQLYNFS